MVTNPGKYSTLGNGSTLSGILDDTDHPHTGLIKSLSVGLGGNYAISGFNITKTNATQFAVASGVIFRDGAKVAISASSSPHGTALTATTNFYHLLTVNSSGAFVLTAPSAASKIPEIPSNSVPIAVIAYKGSASDGSDMYIQYLTITKTDNSLSIGYDSSGYTETLSVVSDSGHTDITAKVADKDIRFKGTDSSSAITALTLDMSEAGLAAFNGNIKVGGNIIQASDGGSTITLDTNDNVTIGNNLKVGGNEIQASDGGSTITMDTNDNVTIGGGLTTTTDLTVNGGDINYGNAQDSTLKVAATTSTTAGRDLTIEAGSTSTGSNNIDGGDLILKSGGGDGTGTSIMTFNTKVSGTDTVAERMRIHTDGKVGIGTNSPDNALQVVNSDSTTNAVVFPLKITEETSGTPATGLGVGIQFEVETSAGNNEIGATIETAITDTTGGSEDFSLTLKTMSGGAAAAERLKFDNSGSMITPMTDGRAHTYMTPGGGMLVSGPTGTKGQLMHGYIQIPDVRNSANNFFELPATSSSTVNTGQIIIIKNVTSASAIISPASGDEIDFAQTTHAMIGTSNVLTLPSMGCVTLCAYISYDKNNLTDANGLGNLQNGWFIVSST